MMHIAERVDCVLPSPPRAIFDKACKLTDVVDLTLGDPDLPPPLNVREAACRAIMAGKTRYSANAGLPALRRAIAMDYRRTTGREVDPDSQVIVTVGAMEASFLALYSTVEPGDEVVIHAPYWINYSQVVRSLGATPVFVNTRPEQNFELQAADVEAALSPKTRLVVLNSPNNPSGAIIPRQTLERIADLSRERGFAVLSDEIYDSLVYDGQKSDSIAVLPGMGERTIVVNGLSKRFAMTGWRLGWAIAPAELVSQMTKMQENIVACAPLPAQHAAIEALEGDTDNSYIRDEFQHRRDVIYQGIHAIPKLSCLKTPATFYTLVDIRKTGLKDYDFVMRLLEEKRVAMVHGSAYGGPDYDGFVRLAFTMKEERLMLALERIADFVQSL
ncbi:MAG: pyridoxal phosphate-dependent aminotransferase [Victivallales bacterium]|nr:pyridoxal phosphate-dependent aminotransferase [Victivallales bacterium]